MTNEDKILLGKFEAKLQRLMYLSDKLKEENEVLKQTLMSKEQLLQKQKQDYKELETNYTNLKQVRIISVNDSEMRDTKQRLSGLVREIDKCLALLKG